MDPINEKMLYELVNKLSLQYFHKPFMDVVKFNSRLRTTGGRYIPGKRTIELNPKYAVEMDGEEFVGIIKHELCHYHLHIEGRGYQHRDEDFRRLLRETGSPRFCKPLPSQRNEYKYVYSCRRCATKYKRKRRVDTNKYRCGKCRGKLVLLTK
ncbi:SprT family protein [Oceanobacillus piezotolerans]|uniref:Protein SprT-like n=1 Tax=Oceanobacillus piezotolerans TaxID=2448030 RepID=A0A498D5D0_9BACI|nr:SprT family protein [Oceanobacillus piezotolerans]RLL42151.1 SprT family protein [Oceanobacillus piezotolerans]